MKRKSMLAVMLVLALAVSAVTGCGEKQKEVAPKEVAAVETAVGNVTFHTTELGNLIVNESVKLSDLLQEVVPEKGQTVKAMTLTYEDKSVTLEVGKDLETNAKDTKEVKPFTIAKVKDAKALFSDKQVPNVTLAFAGVTKKPAKLNVEVALVDKDKKASKADVDINVMVLPETVKPVKAITENLKLSQALKAYDFEVRAKNIADKASDSIESITVKKSNVVFGKVGHYEVSYEIKTKMAGSADVPTDVEVVDKKTEDNLPKDEVVTENVIEVTTTVDIVDKKTEDNLDKDEVIKDSDDTKAPEPAKQPEASKPEAEKKPENKPTTDNGNNGGGNSGGSNSGGGGNGGSNSGGGNNGGGNSKPDKPVEPPHTHSWAPHTATKTVWVPNIVTVEDYGTQAEHAYDSRCNGCGAIFGSASACGDHQLAGCSGGRQNIDCTHVSKVVIGSHTEDHGYNDTQSYTDYYYCGCGATK